MVCDWLKCVQIVSKSRFPFKTQLRKSQKKSKLKMSLTILKIGCESESVPAMKFGLFDVNSKSAKYRFILRNKLNQLVLTILFLFKSIFKNILNCSIRRFSLSDSKQRFWLERTHKSTRSLARDVFKLSKIR